MDEEGMLRPNFFFIGPAVPYRPSEIMALSEKPGYESKISHIRSRILPSPSRRSVGMLSFPNNLGIENSINDTFVMKGILLCFITVQFLRLLSNITIFVAY
jgi:hypothetical protein